MLIFFCKNWHEASFYIKEQAHKINLEFKLKNYFFEPLKTMFLVF